MHMVVDKLMAHSHLKYKGSELQEYSLHTRMYSVHAIVVFKVTVFLMSEVGFRYYLVWF